MPTQKKKTLVKILEKHQVPVIEDDVFGDLSFSTERPDILKCYDKTGNVITISSFSKSLAPGYRTGFIIPGRFKTQFEQIKMSINSCTATPSQLAIAAFLDNGNFDRYLRKVRRVYATNMTCIAESIKKYFPANTRMTHPKGGLSLWIEMPEGIDSVKLYSLAKKEKITFMPGPVFTTTNKFRNYLRINSAYWSDKIESAIKRLGELANYSYSDIKKTELIH